MPGLTIYAAIPTPWRAVEAGILRGGVALLVAALLYVLLADAGEPVARFSARRLLFAVLGAATAALLMVPRPAARGSQGRAFEAYVQGVLAARQTFATSPLLRMAIPGEGRLAAAISEYERANAAYPDSVTFHREAAVLYALAGRWPEARREGERAAGLREQRGDRGAAAERALWEAACGTRPPSARELAALRRGLPGMPLGWYRDALWYAIERRLGHDSAAAAHLAVLADSSNAYLRQALLLAIVRVGLLSLLGMVLLFVFIVLATAGVVRRESSPHPDVAARLWEAFVLFMFLNSAPIVPRLLWGPLRQLSPERTPGTAVALMLLTDLVGLGAVAYLWWRLRQRGLGLDAIGLSFRRPLRSVLWGAGAFVATTPLLLAVGWLTERLSARYFPDVAPPYHPVSGLLVGGQDPWVRVGLLVLVAVGAPFLEEIFFRGALYGALRQRFGTAAALIGSAGLFAILHPQLPLGFIPIFLLGLTFAFLYEWRQSLLPGIVMHAINNGLIWLTFTTLFPLAG
jgi:membrane protease YdiL (CAAX protease family)